MQPLADCNPEAWVQLAFEMQVEGQSEPKQLSKIDSMLIP
jgi:hypothetical protein